METDSRDSDWLNNNVWSVDGVVLLQVLILSIAIIHARQPHTLTWRGFPGFDHGFLPAGTLIYPVPYLVRHL